ncbi:MAG TPA: sensor histidine kinase [Steroidobacteraceae bacterium]|nr:sensor histidine kinase [Steroidobacteraceae bacterium]
MHADETASNAWTAPGLRRRLLGLGLLAWLAVLASVLLRSAGARPLIGGIGLTLGSMFVWLAAFSWNFRQRSSDAVLRRAAPVLLQGAAALATFGFARDATVLILLVVAASQVPGCMSLRAGHVFVACTTLALGAITFAYGGVRSALTLGIGFLAFQYFSMLLAHALTQADQARAELASINARLLATQALLQESARDRERLRITRELHDLIGHKLTALQLNLQVAQRTGAGASPEVSRARDIAAGILTDVRNVVAFVPLDSGVSLQAALSELANSFPGSLVRVTVAPQVRVDDMERAQAVLRCAQEATSNAIRHGRATHIDITLEQKDGALALSIVDDGTGLSDPTPGFGLASIRSRVEEMGGQLALGPASPRGTELRIEIPS